MVSLSSAAVAIQCLCMDALCVNKGSQHNVELLYVRAKVELMWYCSTGSMEL